VLSVLLYNTETWCLAATQAERLKVFEMACLRKIEGVTRRDRIRNEEIYRRVGMNQDILSRIQQRCLRHFGHISRLQDNRYPKIALHGRHQGQRCIRRPKKRWIDTIRSDCEEMNMNIQEALHHAEDRTNWRRSIDACFGIATAIRQVSK